MRLPAFVDERFLLHRLRSTSIAGIASAVVAVVLFEYRLLVNHVTEWDLIAAPVVFVAVKLAAMIWYRTHE